MLLLDTARFKYPPHWVDIELLYEAMCTKDKETDLYRGMILSTRKAPQHERNHQPLELTRQPPLPRCDIANLFRDEKASTIRNSPNRDGLSLLLTFLSDNIQLLF